MAILTPDGLLAGINGLPIEISKTVFSPATVGGWYSLWTAAGLLGAGVNASSGVGGDIPTNATAGAIPFANSGNTYLARIDLVSSGPGQLLIYDRLWQNSGLSVTSTVDQTVNSTALTRPDALGADVEAWLHVFTTLGVGSTAKTISYTDQDGNAVNTGTLTGFFTAAQAQQTFPFALAGTDRGVRSIQSFNNVATSTSGTFGLVLKRLVATHSVINPNFCNQVGALSLGLPRVYDSACLEMVYISAQTVSTSLFGSISLAQG